MLANQFVNGVAHASLHFGERLASGETETAGVLLNLLPFLQLVEIAEVAAGPLAEVSFDETLVLTHSKAGGLGDRCSRLHRRCVDRGDLSLAEGSDAVGRPLGLGLALVAQVKAGSAAREHLAGGWRAAMAHEQNGRRFRRLACLLRLPGLLGGCRRTCH